MTRDALLLELESTRAALRTREAALREKDLELAAERARVVAGKRLRTAQGTRSSGDDRRGGDSRLR